MAINIKTISTISTFSPPPAPNHSTEIYPGNQNKSPPTPSMSLSILSLDQELPTVQTVSTGTPISVPQLNREENHLNKIYQEI